MSAIVAFGVILWSLGYLDGRIALISVLAWFLVGWAAAPSIMYEHLGFLDRYVFNDYSKARSRYRKAFDTGKATADGICALASLSFAEGDDVEAISLLEIASVARPEDPYIFALLSRALSRSGMHDQAIAAAMKCHLSPLGETALGDALRAKGIAIEAAEVYKKAVSRSPGLIEARLGLAGAYLDMADAGAAYREARRALSASPKDPDALYWTARALEASGNSREASRLYRTALAERPIGDMSFSVPYEELVRAVSASPIGGSSGARPKDAAGAGSTGSRLSGP